MALKQEGGSFSHLFFGSWGVVEVRAHLSDLERVDIDVGNLHNLFVVGRVLGGDAQVVLLPVPVDAALVVALSVEHVVAVLDIGQDLALVDGNANASPDPFFHINLAVIVVTQARVHVPF